MTHVSEAVISAGTDRANQGELAAPRNKGVPFQESWLTNVRINRAAVERRAATMTTRRGVKKQYQTAWLLKAITLIDLTTLAGDDTEERVKRLCHKALHPVRSDILADLGASELPIRAGAVCVYHEMIPAAKAALGTSGMPIAAVSTGFPAGLSPAHLREEEIRESVAAGATEIDIVISRRYVLQGNWQALYDEIKRYREACGDAHLKTILATGELATFQQVYQASMVCMMAGADFIKTSTGKESVNATIPVSLVMIRAIRDYFERTGQRVGFKPAGGLRTAKDAIAWLILVKEELGPEWLEPELLRFGASSLLADIERQLEHQATGAYSALHRHPAG